MNIKCHDLMNVSLECEWIEGCYDGRGSMLIRMMNF